MPNQRLPLSRNTTHHVHNQIHTIIGKLPHTPTSLAQSIAIRLDPTRTFQDAPSRLSLRCDFFLSLEVLWKSSVMRKLNDDICVIS